MLRQGLTALLGLLLVVPLVLTGAGPASAATGITVTRATVQTFAPAQTRPMTDECFSGSSAYNCGFGVVDVTLSGFDAYGGIPECATEYVEACFAPRAEMIRTVGTRIDVLVRCAGEWFPRGRTVRVDTGPGGQDSASLVGPWSRVDSDTAQVRTEFYLPPPSSLGACAPGAPVTYLGAVARSVTVGWGSEVGAVPAGSATVRGLHRFPTQR